MGILVIVTELLRLKQIFLEEHVLTGEILEAKSEDLAMLKSATASLHDAVMHC